MVFKILQLAPAVKCVLQTHLTVSARCNTEKATEHYTQAQSGFRPLLIGLGEWFMH